MEEKHIQIGSGTVLTPEKIENVYAKCKFIAQCFIYGDSFNFLLVAVVSVEQDAFRVWVASQGLQGVDLGQLCNDLRSRAAVLADMDAIRREAQLRGFEFAKSVTLVLEPFTVEDRLLTPTFKVLEQILGVLIKLVKDLKLHHQHEYDERQKT